MKIGLTADDMSYWSVSLKHFFVEKGLYKVMIGSSSDNLPLFGNFAV